LVFEEDGTARLERLSEVVESLKLVQEDGTSASTVAMKKPRAKKRKQPTAPAATPAPRHAATPQAPIRRESAADRATSLLKRDLEEDQMFGIGTVAATTQPPPPQPAQARPALIDPALQRALEMAKRPTETKPAGHDSSSSGSESSSDPDEDSDD
jgi:hypothetical protein